MSQEAEANAKLKSVKASSSSDEPEPCAICLENLGGRLGVAHPCGHVFHQCCFGSWDLMRFKSSQPTVCPTCREPVHMFTRIHSNVRALILGDDLSTPPSSSNFGACTSPSAFRIAEMSVELQELQVQLGNLKIQLREERTQRLRKIYELSRDYKTLEKELMEYKLARQLLEEEMEEMKFDCFSMDEKKPVKRVAINTPPPWKKYRYFGSGNRGI